MRHLVVSIVHSAVQVTKDCSAFVLLQLFATLAVAAYARPEAGYSYSAPSPAPSTSYGAPAGLGGASFSSGALSNSISSGAGSLGFGGSSGAGSLGFGASSGALNFGSSGASSFAGAGASSFSSAAGFGASAGGASVVQKHIYVHVPPPEPEEFRPQKQIQFAPPQKHYKIIFIKAPTPPTPTVPTIPLQPQNEEKTLVYVLVKKPEDAPEITIPTAAPTQPSKPEVYFIRYKTQKEAAAAIGGGISGAAIGGGISGAVDAGGLGDDAESIIVGGKGSAGLAGSASFNSGASFSGASAGVSSSYGPPGYQPGPH